MSDRLVLLGTKGGPALRPGGSWPTSSFLNLGGRQIVVDCGLGVTRGLVNAGVALKSLDLIFITHLHSDHTLEFGPLLHTAWTAGLATRVEVYGPPGLDAVWAGFCASMRYDIELRIGDEGRPDLRDLVKIHTYGEGAVMAKGALDVQALRVVHPPVTDCFALRFAAGGKVVTFSADTAYFPPLAEFARGSDILVHEAMLMEGVDRIVALTGNGERLLQHLVASHSTAAEAATIARDAEVKHLVLHHMIPADDADFGEDVWRAAVAAIWSGQLSVGHDGMELEI